MSLEARVAGYLGKNVVQLRQARGLSQAGLAALSGVPRSTINYIESGAGNPSLQNLVKLSEALKVPLEELIHRPTLEVQLLGQREVGVRTQGKAKVYNLLPSPVAGVEMERIEIAPGGSFTGVPHLKGTREYFICLSGTAHLHVAGTAYVVKKGELLIFPGDERHAYQNRSRRALEAISVVLFGR